MQNPVLLARSISQEFEDAGHSDLLQAIIQRYNIKLEAYDFVDSIAGVLIVTDEYAVIGYNDNHPPARQRFTIAHEIGHYLMEHKSMCSVIGENITTDANWEYAANAFAAELLMPKDEIIKLIGYDMSRKVMANCFGVSVDALTLRLKKLNLDSMVVEFSDFWDETEEDLFG